MSKTVNGPYNIVRLEGYINDKKKIIYLFSDIHTDDYECDDIDSPDINKYLLEVFRKAKKKLPDKHYDFFVETHTRPEHKHADNLKRREYIYMIRKMFYHLKRKKRLLSDEMNVRLHYTDFRDYLNNNTQIIHTATEVINNMFSNEWINTYNINNIVGIIAPISDTISNLKHLINDNLKKINIDNKQIYFTHGDVTAEESNNILNNIFVKIRYNYKNRGVQSILTEIMTNINTVLSDMSSKYTHFIKFLNKIKHPHKYPYPGLTSNLRDVIKTICDIKIYLLEITAMNTYIHTILIDIFMLRRFLDKEYITNALYYCGGSHVNIITTILVKYFNFEITHIAKSDETVDKLNERLKNTDIYNFNSIRTVMKPSYQCSSLEGFPDLLT